MSPSVVALAARLPGRFESKGAQHGLAYPWWIAAIGAGGQVVCAVVATGQRGALLPPEPLALAVVLVLVPLLLQLTLSRWVPWYVDCLFVLTAVYWLMASPAEIPPPENLGPGVAMFLAASATATDGARPGLVATAASCVVVLAGDRVGSQDPNIDMYLLEILMGFVVGYMLRWQMRALAAERSERERERERATLAERQRIAREIHDLVAHSLSVTMLHVTGAKQALVEDADVDDAVAALEDAEQVGRQAMAEIRRTVSVLRTEPSGAHPLPGAEDIDALVAQVRDAGLSVDYAVQGELTRLSPAVGLGVYRILQESLTNVAKHAPGETAAVRVEVGPDRAVLSVRNRRARGSVDPGGSGTSGMAARAEQIGGRLEVGPAPEDPRQWRVDLAVPVTDPQLVVREALR